MTETSEPLHGTLAFRCAVCETERVWRIDRVGDAVVSWACTPHLGQVCASMQRNWEITELSVIAPEGLEVPRG